MGACAREEPRFAVTETRVPLQETFLPPDSLDGWPRGIWIDFGRWDLRASGAVAMSQIVRYQEAAWTGGMARNWSTTRVIEPFYRTWIEGEDATLTLGRRAGPQRLVLWLGNPEFRRGPCRVRINGEPVGPPVSTQPREYVLLDVRGVTNSDTLSIHFESVECGSFSVTGLVFYDPPEARVRPALWPIFPAHPAMPPPPSAPTPPHDAVAGSQAAVRDYFLAAYDNYGSFSQAGAWYQNMFPIRALVGNPTAMEDPRVRAAIVQVVERFVEAQHEDGTWSSDYFGVPGCPLSNEIARGDESANLADVGSMALCLTLAQRLSTPEQADRFRAAAQRYAERFVMPAQLADGAFPNLRWQGTHYTVPYTIATATQGLQLFAWGSTSHDDRIRKSGWDALAWLAASVQPSGALLFRHHDRTEAVLMTAREMGDLFYVMDSLLEALAWATPEESALLLDSAGRLVEGPSGLLAVMNDPTWWDQAEPWEQAKRIGAASILMRYRLARGMDGDLTPMEARLLAACASPEHGAWYGAFIPQSRIGGEHGATATGLAGMALNLYASSPSRTVEAP